jgi:hypothetical protein
MNATSECGPLLTDYRNISHTSYAENDRFPQKVGRIGQWGEDHAVAKTLWPSRCTGVQKI